MTYRDDLDAARLRRESLSRELADVRARIGDRNALLDQERQLAAELEDTQAHIDHARKRVELPLLRDVRVASPCKESWDAMKGDDRVRFCGRCEKNVFDLSEMTAVEAESVLAAHGGAACVRFYRRADGTVMTSDCPEGALRRRRRKLLLVSAVAAGTMASAGAVWLRGGESTRHKSDYNYGMTGGTAVPSEPYVGTGSASATAVETGVTMGSASGWTPETKPDVP